MGNKPLDKNEKNQIDILELMYLDLLKKQKSYIGNLIYKHNKNQTKLEKRIALLQKEVEEYRGFKKGKIWKYLILYRNVKKLLIKKSKSIWKK